LPVAVAAAHRHGLELIAVMKPFAGASIITWPDGSPEAARHTGLHRIGGTMTDAFKWLEDRPELRIARRPSTPTSGHLAAIRLTKADASPTRVDSDHLEIWTSPGNWRYRRRDMPFKVREEVRDAPSDVRD